MSATVSPASRTAREMKYEFSPSNVGWSRLSIAGSNFPRKSPSRNTTSRWSVPIASATRRACNPSLTSASSNASVNVLTRSPRPTACCARFATALESIPPDKNTPSGTSLTRC